ncbi:hypothetical protein JXA31_04240 [Candidatus Bathyarchaeota archaeon]|nr:hypothetical protein [Candidatus Bathyarchaeota archaeon]
MSEVAYNRYDEAYRAIHSALMDIACPPPGRRITKLAFVWSVHGALEALRAYDDGDLLFTLVFSWGADATLREVART